MKQLDEFTPNELTYLIACMGWDSFHAFTGRERTSSNTNLHSTLTERAVELGYVSNDILRITPLTDYAKLMAIPIKYIANAIPNGLDIINDAAKTIAYIKYMYIVDQFFFMSEIQELHSMGWCIGDTSGEIIKHFRYSDCGWVDNANYPYSITRTSFKTTELDAWRNINGYMHRRFNFR